MKRLTLIFLIGLNSLLVQGGTNDEFSRFKTAFLSSDYSKRYEVQAYCKPTYLISDFNGDHQKDIAVLIINKKTQQQGIIIYHLRQESFYIVGAGEILDKEANMNGMDWVNTWRINTKRINEPGVQGGPNLILKADSIEITKEESGGGLIYWNGKKYAYFHQSC